MQFLLTCCIYFRPNLTKVLRQCKYLIRRLEYEEIAKNNKIEALRFLQTRLFEIIDHKDQIQLKEVNYNF